jgi:thioredoxin:protein disulfide reductase
MSIRSSIKNSRIHFGEFLLLFMGLVLATSSGFAFAAGDVDEEFGDPTPIVNAYISHSALPAGETGTILVTMDIPHNFHIQINDFLDIYFPDEASIDLGKLAVTPNGTWDDEPVLVKKASFSIPFTFGAAAETGPVTFTVAAGWQGCSEGPVYACFPPDEANFTFTVDLLASGGAAELINSAVFAANNISAGSEGSGQDEPMDSTDAGIISDDSLEGRLRAALVKGSLIAFLIVFVAGVLSSLTPCVYPMIPITISYVGGKAGSRMHGFMLSVFFVLGIAITYSILGLVAAGTGAVFGSMMQSTAAMFVVAGIFVTMGASMLGAFDIALPSSLTTSMTSAGMSAGGTKIGDFVGAVLMGATTGLVASPCVGPVLVVLLTFVADTGSFFLGFWLLFTFACGLGLLFLVLGTFAGAIQSMPGGGSWMDTVKHVFGVVLIAMALFYVRAFIPPETMRFILGVFLVIVGVFSGAFTAVSAEASKSDMFRKSIGILVFLAGAVVFLLWIFSAVGGPAILTAGFSLPAAGLSAGEGKGDHPGPAWEIFDASRTDDEAILSAATTEGKPVVIDFWATWCGACIELDHETWVDPEVMAEAERFAAMKMDATKRNDYTQDINTRYEVRGMPTVIFYDSSGNEAHRFVGFKKADDVLAIMKTIH